VSTPSDYYAEYRQLTVRLVDGRILLGVDVHRYRNAQDVFDWHNTDNDPSNDVDNMRAELDAGPGWHTAWGALSAKIAQYGQQVGKDLFRLQFPLPTKADPKPAVAVDEFVFLSELAAAYIGKGTPERCAQALRLAEAFGLVSGTLGAMQKYCDDYIGLDCNGFVGGYLKRRGCTVAGPETPAYPYAFVPPNWRLSKLEDVQSESVLIWKTDGHVAIVDRVIGPVYVPPKFDSWVLRCLVCESTGAQSRQGDVNTNGLNYTTYEIHPPGRDQVFKVKRGLGGPWLNDVYIGNLLPSFR
jgi:hypothetical protein